MGFNVRIETDGETLQNIHPDGGKGSGGKAVFNFLSILSYYDSFKGEELNEDDGLKASHDWFIEFEEKAGDINKCRAFIDCMWGDGGDDTKYRQGDYDLFIKRHGAVRGDGVENTEESFLKFVKASEDAYQHIEDVIEGVRFLLDSFKKYAFESNFFFMPEDPPYLEDFEALLWNLEFLAKRGNTKVRLTFS
jgi:hypothetical protein